MEVQESCSALFPLCDAGHLDARTWFTTQECDQDSTNKGENYKEELAEWESWLKWIRLTHPKKTEDLKNPSFVYVLCVNKEMCIQDTQHLPVNQRPAMAGQQRETVEEVSGTAKHHVIRPALLCNSWLNKYLISNNEKGSLKKCRYESKYFTLRPDRKQTEDNQSVLPQ